MEINHPKHYNQYPVEVIDMMINIWGKEATRTFCLLNAFKYRMRVGHKDDIQDDLAKEKWYLDKAEELGMSVDDRINQAISGTTPKEALAESVKKNKAKRISSSQTDMVDASNFAIRSSSSHCNPLTDGSELLDDSFFERIGFKNCGEYEWENDKWTIEYAGTIDRPTRFRIDNFKNGQNQLMFVDIEDENVLELVLKCVGAIEPKDRRARRNDLIGYKKPSTVPGDIKTIAETEIGY